MKLSTEARRVSRASLAALRHVEGCPVCSPFRRNGARFCGEGTRLFTAQDQAMQRWRDAAPPMSEQQRREVERDAMKDLNAHMGNDDYG